MKKDARENLCYLINMSYSCVKVEVCDHRFELDLYTLKRSILVDITKRSGDYNCNYRQVGYILSIKSILKQTCVN